MAQHDSFELVPIGVQFTVAEWHATAGNTALVLTKKTETTATDESGQVWSFANCLGLECYQM